MCLRILFIVLLVSSGVLGQSPYILPGTITDEIADRWDILYDFEQPIFASQRNISREEITTRALFLLNKPELSSIDKWDISYILKDNNDYTSKGLNLTGSGRKKVYSEDGVFYHLEEDSMVINIEEGYFRINQQFLLLILIIVTYLKWVKFFFISNSV